MATFWVVFGHSAVIPKNEKWPADIGGSNPGLKDHSLPPFIITSNVYKND